ncbi:CD209 antigen-like protein C isoform X1 [Labeo rohita]|uniref:CD209 antigen-like protein C isoform X1 n=1 Tax=Labeo rohita TaxID=84645 RepID=UPI0021E1F8AF|nr:CD209 antigen-like protein C isoform X1 [Labeo rohita]
MESEVYYVNFKKGDINNSTGPQTQSQGQDDGKSQKSMRFGRFCNPQGSRSLVLITVGLGLICVLLLVFVILQHITITAERDRIKSYKNTVKEFNQTISGLQDNYTDLKTEKDQLQNNFRSLSQQILELESQVRSLKDELNMDASERVCLFISNELNWADSRQYCRDHGGDLVIINTEEKQRFIFSLVEERVWIGLSDREQEGNMKWVDNSPLNEGFWLGGEPNNQDGNEDCVELIPSHPVLNSWNDLPCSKMKKGICEK